MATAERWRTTVIDCIDWSVAALATHGPKRFDPTAEPVALIAQHRVVATNRKARQLGVTTGLRRREAQRRAPELLVCTPDPDLDQIAFAAVLRALDQLTPRVTITAPGWCSFATRGPARYFGGEQAMGRHAIAVVQAVLDEDFGGGAIARAATAGSLFAARCAVRSTEPGQHLVVAPGDTQSFLADLPITQIADRGNDQDLLEVFARLGIEALGDLGELSRRDVLARFGTRAASLHALAMGETIEPPIIAEIPAELSVGISLDPPLMHVDQGAFIAKNLAEEFCAGLSSRGSACDQIAIDLETETGERLSRLWRAEGALDQAAIAQRVRWQLDGWLNGPHRSRPSAGLSRMVLRPDQVIAATGRQMGLWGEASGGIAKANRAVARLRGSRPDIPIWGLERAEGRSVDELVRSVSIDAIDLVERDRRHAKGQFNRAVAFDVADATPRVDSYSGAVPYPYPAVVLNQPISVQVLADDSSPIIVRVRGLLDAAPRLLRSPSLGSEPEVIEAWAGPWLLDERWWDEERHRRAARFQFLLATGIAVLVETRQGVWWLIGVYR